MKIATIINFCTNDDRFLKKAVDEVQKFSHQILVPVCDHFFDGTEENRDLLNQTYLQFPSIHFLEFRYTSDKLYTPYIQRLPTDEDWGCLWHSTARYLAFLYLSDEIDHLLFLDADEIVEGIKFKDWLARTNLKTSNAYWFSSYCYGFEASKRAPHLQQTALLVKREALSPLKILNSQERFGIFGSLPGPKKLDTTYLDGSPMIHHYSWVRPEEECLKKASTWGKKHHCNWPLWIENAKREMNDYQDVVPYFDPLLEVCQHSNYECASAKANEFPNVIKITPEIAFIKSVNAIL